MWIWIILAVLMAIWFFSRNSETPKPSNRFEDMDSREAAQKVYEKEARSFGMKLLGLVKDSELEEEDCVQRACEMHDKLNCINKEFAEWSIRHHYKEKNVKKE